MICADELLCLKVKKSVSNKRVLCGILVLITVAGLSGCGNKDKKAGQTLARVDGEEITVLQINDEIMRAGAQAGKQEAANTQFLEALIDRQLILAEAMRNKIDRSPEVMQAIERAKAQIIAQAYLKSIASKVAKPSKAEIDDYYQKHPEFFAKRKEFDLKQLAFASKNLSEDLKLFIDSAKTIDEVAAWLDKHGVLYARRQVTRSTSDLPQKAAEQLLALAKGKLFFVTEGDNTVLNIVVASQDSPVTIANATPRIEQFLFAQKSKEAVEVEIAHLRSLAKIEYLNASAPAAVQTPAAAGDNKPAVPK